MKKGVILSISRRYITLLTPEGEFVKVKREKQQYELGEEIHFSIPDRAKYFSLFYLPIKKTVVACLVALCLLFVNGMIHNTDDHVAAYVTIDINPSIEISVNEKLEVIDIRGLNESGKLLLYNLPNWKGHTIYEVTEGIIKKINDLGYSRKQGKSLVLATTMLLEDKKLTKKLTKEMNKIKRPELKVVQGSLHDRIQAEKQGLSTGRYLQILEEEKMKKLKKKQKQEKKLVQKKQTTKEKQSLAPITQQKVENINRVQRQTKKKQQAPKEVKKESSSKPKQNSSIGSKKESEKTKPAKPKPEKTKPEEKEATIEKPKDREHHDHRHHKHDKHKHKHKKYSKPKSKNKQGHHRNKYKHQKDYHNKYNKDKKY